MWRPSILLISYFLAVSGASWGAFAASHRHPCKAGEPVRGALYSGNGFSFRIAGDERLFGLKHLHIGDAAAITSLMQKGALAELYIVSEKPDRYRRHLAHLFLDRVWIQGAALEKGYGLFNGQSRWSACVTAMEAAEQRAEKKPFSASKLTAIAAREGKMTIIEGVVKSVGDRKSRIYLNFGQKWSEDVTGLARRKGRDGYQGDWSKLLTLSGKRIRLRGVVEKSGGPMIRIFHEAQISIVE